MSGGAPVPARPASPGLWLLGGNAARRNPLLELRHAELDRLGVLTGGVLDHGLLLGGELDPDLVLGVRHNTSDVGDYWVETTELHVHGGDPLFQLRHAELHRLRLLTRRGLDQSLLLRGELDADLLLGIRHGWLLGGQLVLSERVTAPFWYAARQ